MLVLDPFLSSFCSFINTKTKSTESVDLNKNKIKELNCNKAISCLVRSPISQCT